MEFKETELDRKDESEEFGIQSRQLSPLSTDLEIYSSRLMNDRLREQEEGSRNQ